MGNSDECETCDGSGSGYIGCGSPLGQDCPECGGSGLSADDSTTLPTHLADMGGWVDIPGLGWLREVRGRDGGTDFWWWHRCPSLIDRPERNSLRHIDCSTGERHAITGGSLTGGDLTIHGGSGSIPCHDCGLHGWVRNGKWVKA